MTTFSIRDRGDAAPADEGLQARHRLMAALEESLAGAIRAKSGELREQRLRGEWVLAAAAS